MNNPTRQTTKVEQQFLQFQLSDDITALLPVNQMIEVLTLFPSQIVPIPHLPAYVMGVYNWRGEILWMVDLGYLVGHPPLYQQVINPSNYTAIVAQSGQLSSGERRTFMQVTGKKVLGLVVNRVEDMEWLNPDLIQSPTLSAVQSELVPFLRGYYLKLSGEILVVLDSNAIIARMPQSE